MNRRWRDLIVSLFILGGVILAIAGYLWFSGRLTTKRERTIRIYFPDVSGLKVGDRVDVLGITKGRVKAVRLNGERGVEVTVVLERDVRLTEGTRFVVRSLSYLGSDRYLAITPGKGRVVADSIGFQGENEVLDMETTFLRLNQLLNIVDPAVLSNELRQTRDEILGLVSIRLKGLDSGFVFTSANIQRLTMVVDSLTVLLRRESTVKKMLTSSEIYDELLKTTKQLQDLMLDIKNHPEKYFRLRIF